MFCQFLLIILRAAPSAAGLLRLRGIAIWRPWCLLFEILGAIGTSREHLGRQFWHLGSTLGCHFGTSGPPGGPWEQQDGHEVTRHRILVDLGVSSGLVYVECLKKRFSARFAFRFFFFKILESIFDV